MSETLLLYVWTVKFLLVGLCAVLYRLGGQFWKPYRRFIMPFVYMLGCSFIGLWKHTFSWWVLLSLPLLIGSLCLGYGGVSFWEKFKRRTIYGLALALAFLPFAFVYNSWGLYCFHALLCLLSSVYFGVANPFSSDGAVGEEATIATFSLIMPILMI